MNEDKNSTLKRHSRCTGVLQSAMKMLVSEKYTLGVIEMAGISKEQQEKDEQSLVGFLTIFNIALLCVFLVICLYNSV
jgi:hypothetical protein